MISKSAMPSGNLASVIFLKDSYSKIQVLIPANRLLDLKQLAHQLGRQCCTALLPDEMQSLKYTLGLDNFPAPPQLTQIETLVDHSLLENNSLYIPSDTNDTLLQLPAEQVRALIAHSQLGHYSAPPKEDPFHATASEDMEDINTAIQQFTLLRVQPRLQDTLDLPPLPETARRIIELRIDPDANLESQAHTLQQNPAINEIILNWKHSPCYQSKDTEPTIKETILHVLGVELVSHLALGRHIDMPHEGPRGYTPFWQQAAMGAELASELSRRCPEDKQLDCSLANLAGLLHNFGFLLLAHVFPHQLALINRYIEANPHINRSCIERHVLALTREQIAACLIDQWHLPDEVVTALRQQHNSRYNGAHAHYARLLNITTRSLRAHGYGDGPKEALDTKILQALGLDKETVRDATETVIQRARESMGQSSVLSA
ncbi:MULTISPECIES: aminoacyl-tRNA deacylase and HDOD domain-containing protein [unclassified Oceanobacter]|uniref:aminoacyl-tRNA deacylase and HDOD domain-containing protein n=1 Tax=unclassified Oceanobacter TaxID=2620260 RepID=UPI002735EAC4|nr:MULTISPECIES: HDOD domain-containing protein [unclassified Oceanobacter]MDP2608429.1 HDOD domain-containing protein [Oceanobacter sp. 1_MG-2023]MDP2611524.1 HDOD domain-containing protein [Oceanobacter sp. 2_MG-2023]